MTHKHDYSFFHWCKKHALKIGALLLRGALLGTVVWIKQSYHRTTNEMGQALLHFFATSKQWAIIFMCFYAIRSLIFFPAGISTIIGWILFGPVRWSVYTYIGENMSASLSWCIWRYFRSGDTHLVQQPSNKIVKQIQTYLQGNDFMATLTLRLIPINFDMINYVCGIYGVKRKPYALATAIGIIPGMITYVLIWATFHGSTSINFDQIHLNKQYLLLSVVLYAISFFGAALIKKYKKKR